MGESRPTTLRIDGEDRIVSFDMEWVRFALENDAPELTRPSLVGLSVWSFVQGERLRDVWAGVFDRVRRDRWPIDVSIRCDSRSHRRSMVVQVVPRGPRDLEMRTFTLSTSRHDAPFLSPHLERSKRLVRICSVCKSFQVGEGERQDLDDVVRELGSLATTFAPTLQHDLCPVCDAVLDGLGSSSRTAMSG